MTNLYGLEDRIANRVMRHLPANDLQVGAETPIVSFTFDDVPDSALETGATILEARGVRGTFYIAGGLVDGATENWNSISAGGCRELAARGHEVGCHTFTHRNTRRLTPSELDDELERNASFLRDVTGVVPRNFAFPYNIASPMARKVLSRRFRTCRGGHEGINRRLADSGYLKSIEIRQPESHARSLTRWIDDLVARPGWLIFFTHDVAAAPSPYGCQSETLDLLVRYAIERGCSVMPVDAALDLGVEDRKRSRRLQEV
jgi:peptidoglycan/xylan/chitin deacetylase (PgdA/CDA1 family)